MSILSDVQELVKADVISEESASRIIEYYQKKEDSPKNRLYIIFGVFGAILLGLGAFLIISQNWEKLSTTVKTVMAFTPMVVGQIFCVYVLLNKQESIAWKEGVSAFLFFSVGGCISLVSLIYDIPSDEIKFILTWMLLTIPLVYIMKSSIVSLMYTIGITFYAIFADSGASVFFSTSDPNIYWVLFLLVLPHYYSLLREKTESIFMSLHHWIIPGSLIISMGIVAEDNSMIMVLAYFFLFSLFYLLGTSGFFAKKKPLVNGYKLLGSLGSIILLLVMSFKPFWKEIRTEKYQLAEIYISPEFIATIAIFLIAAVILIVQIKKRSLKHMNPQAPLFILIFLTYLIGTVSPVAVIIINILILVLGVLTVRAGVRQDHLGVLNYGLIVIAALAVCRFFDEDLSLVLRGTMFVVVGIGFFATNYYLIVKRKANE
jgi:uncharacterized membrane protein